LEVAKGWLRNAAFKQMNQGLLITIEPLVHLMQKAFQIMDGF
jgi:hypothetical protein